MKTILTVILSLLLITPAHPEYWTYQGDEWPLPKTAYTEKDFKRYETARKWFLFAGGALLVGSYIANKNARGLSNKADNYTVPASLYSLPSPNGGITFYTQADQSALDSRARVRSKAKAYRTGAAIGAVLSAVCFSIGYSLRF